jgi:hypothetical protein
VPEMLRDAAPTGLACAPRLKGRASPIKIKGRSGLHDVSSIQESMADTIKGLVGARHASVPKMVEVRFVKLLSRWLTAKHEAVTYRKCNAAFYTHKDLHTGGIPHAKDVTPCKQPTRTK